MAFIHKIVSTFSASVSSVADKLGFSFFIEDAVKASVMAIKNPQRKQIEFLLAFDQWVQDGANLLEAVREIKGSAERHGKKNDFIYRAAVDLEVALKNGFPPSAGMQRNFSAELVSIFKIGEESDNISELLHSYLTQEESRKDVFSQGLKPAYQPAFLVFLTFSILVAIADYGLPYAASEGLELNRLYGIPSLTVSLAKAVSAMWTGGAIVAVTAWLTYILSKKHYVGKYSVLPSRSTLDKFVPFSIHKEYVAMTIIQRIGLLAKVGLPIGRIVTILMKTATPYEAAFYSRIKQRTTSTNGTVENYFDVGLLNTEVFARLSGIAKQQGETAKVKAILAASRDSGDLAAANIKRALTGVTLSLWIIFAITGGITGLGLALLTYQIQNILPIN